MVLRIIISDNTSNINFHKRVAKIGILENIWLEYNRSILIKFKSNQNEINHRRN